MYTILLLVWLLVGFISTWISIGKFRPNGTCDVCEMYGVAIAPFFGFITMALLIIDSRRCGDRCEEKK